MADITLRLICYRLGELYENTAQLHINWSNLDILDVFFLGWCIFGLLVVLLANIPSLLEGTKALPFRDLWGRIKKRIVYLCYIAWASLNESEPSTDHPDPLGESCHWLNNLITWYFLNKNSSPEFLNVWLEALNQAIARREKNPDKIITFQEILVGSLPPKILRASAKHCLDTHNLGVNLKIRADEIRLKVLLPDQRLCEVTLADITCDVLSDLRLCSRGFRGSLKLADLSNPRADVRLLDGDTSGRLVDAVDQAWITRQVIAAVSGAVTEISSSPQSPLEDTPPAAADIRIERLMRDAENQTESKAAEATPSVPPWPTPPPPAHESPVLVAKAALASSELPPASPVLVSNAPVDPASSIQRPLTLTADANSSSYSTGGGRLLVKVIKANGLLVPATSSSTAQLPLMTHVCVELDQPHQRHETSGVHCSNNPFWDQHFVFSLSPQSSSLNLRVLHRDRRRQEPPQLLGAASLPLSQVPPAGARVLQPLRPSLQHGQAPPTVTLELLFMSGGNSNKTVADSSNIAPTLSPVPPLPLASPEPDDRNISSSGVASSSSTSGSSTPSVVALPARPATLEPMPAVLVTPAEKSPPATPPRSSLSSSSCSSSGEECWIRKMDHFLDSSSSSLSRVVDEFMTSPDFSYHVSSFSESTLNGASRAISSTDIADQLTDAAVPPAYNEYMSLGRKPKSQKPTRTGSVASRIKRVFSGRKRDSAQVLPPHAAMPATPDSVLSAPNGLLPSPGTNGGADGSSGVTPSLSKSKSRGLSSSFRRLFSSRRKQQQQRRTSESVEPELPPPTTFYSLPKTKKTPRLRMWDSDEIL